MHALIVDDLPANRILLRSILELAGMVVQEAADGQEALAVMRCALPDVVVSDILMPNMDGFRFCMEVRSDPRLAQVPFIVYTSTYNSPSDRNLALKVGVDRYVLKPAPAAELLATIEAVMQEGPRQMKPTTAAHDELTVIRQYNAALVQKLEQKNQELTLALDRVRDREERFRALVEASAQIVWTGALDGRAVEDSPSWRAFTGQSFEAWRELGWLDAVHPEDRGPTLSRWKAGLQSQSSMEFEYRLRHHSAGWRWMAVRAVRLSDAAGTPLGWVGMNTDIHEQKQTSEFLAGKRRALEMIATGRPLEETLRMLLRIVETRSEEYHGRILLVDETGSRLRLGVRSAGLEAKGDPVEFVIGEGVSACGTAAFRRRRVTVRAEGRNGNSAAPHGAPPCWSTPLLDGENQLLGTLDILPQHGSEPTERELRFVDALGHIAAIAVRSHQRDTRNRSQLEELLRWQELVLDREDRICALKGEVNRLLESRQAAPRYASVSQPV